MPKFDKLTAEEEKLIINFVKSNDVLYNPSHADYSDNYLKSRLWKQIGYELGIPGQAARHKWKAMKDYFFRSKYLHQRPQTAVRNEMMSFLWQPPVLPITEPRVPKKRKEPKVKVDQIKLQEEILAALAGHKTGQSDQ